MLFLQSSTDPVISYLPELVMRIAKTRFPTLAQDDAMALDIWSLTEAARGKQRTEQRRIEGSVSMRWSNESMNFSEPEGGQFWLMSFKTVQREFEMNASWIFFILHIAWKFLKHEPYNGIDLRRYIHVHSDSFLPYAIAQPTCKKSSQIKVGFVVENARERGESEDGEDLIVGIVEVQRQLTRRFPCLSHGDQDQRFPSHKHVFVLPYEERSKGDESHITYKAQNRWRMLKLSIFETSCNKTPPKTAFFVAKHHAKPRCQILTKNGRNKSTPNGQKQQTHWSTFARIFTGNQASQRVIVVLDEWDERLHDAEQRDEFVFVSVARINGLPGDAQRENVLLFWAKNIGFDRYALAATAWPSLWTDEHDC